MSRMKEQYTATQEIMTDLKQFMGEEQFNLLYYFLRTKLEPTATTEPVVEAEIEVAKAFKEMMETIE